MKLYDSYDFHNLIFIIGMTNQNSIQRALKKLIRCGVPHELRGEVWFACSGAAQKMVRSLVLYVIDA